jgi:hypothetical protein
MQPDMGKNTAASGGMTATMPHGGASVDAGPPQPMPRSPEDSPMLSAPTQRPGEPLTTGMATGAGAGPEALGVDPRVAETQALRKWVPLLSLIANKPDTPTNVKNLYNYISGF